MKMEGAHVEIVDVSLASGGGPLMPSQVLVNGVDVGLVAKGGVRLDTGGIGEATTVTLTLLPQSVVIRSATAPDPV